MSPAFREEMEAIIEDYFRQIVEMVSASRKLTAEQVTSIIDTGLFSAEDAKKVGLIDHVGYEDHITTLIKGDQKDVEIKYTKGYGKKKFDTDFSGFSGMAKMMNMLMGVEPSSRKSSNAKIAVISAVGPIMSGSSQSDFFGDESMGSSTMIKAIRQARDDATVKAVVLRVDSPGGSALASEDACQWHTERIHAAGSHAGARGPGNFCRHDGSGRHANVWSAETDRRGRTSSLGDCEHSYPGDRVGNHLPVLLRNER